MAMLESVGSSDAHPASTTRRPAPERSVTLRALTSVYCAVGYALGTFALLVGVREWFGDRGGSVLLPFVSAIIGTVLLVAVAHLAVTVMDTAEQARRTA